MNSFKAYIKKEIIEGIRSYRFLIICLVMVLFAIFDPLLLKLLPVLVGNEIPKEILESINITKTFAIQNYIKDISQLVSIVVILTLMGLLADERQNKTLVFPYSKGVSVTGLIIGKKIVYSLTLPLFIFIGFCVNYYYSSILFNEGSVNFVSILKIAGLFSVYYIFIVSLIIFLGSISRKKLFVGIGTLAVVFLLSALGNIEAIKDFLPSSLTALAGKILTQPSLSQSDINSMLVTIGSVLLYMVVLNLLSVYRMNRVEII